MPTSTVCAVLKRLGLNRLRRLEPPEPPNRYCRRHSGELIHIDVKKLRRFNRAGLPAHLHRRGYAANTLRELPRRHRRHDPPRYVEILDDEKGPTCVAFLRRAIDHFVSLGIRFRRVMTDNGTGYLLHVHLAAIAELEIQHLRCRWRGKSRALP